MKTMLYGLFLLFGSLSLQAQECVFYCPTKEGASVEYNMYDATGNLTLSSVHRVVKINIRDNETRVIVSVESYDANGSANGNTTTEYYCKDGVFYDDVQKMLDKISSNQNQDATTTWTSVDPVIPGVLTVGQSLPESSMSMYIMKNGLPFPNFKSLTYNRKVEAIETIKTTIGDYECYKITYDHESNIMGKKTNTKGAQWYVKNIGIIKTEEYDADGKLKSYTVLTNFKD